MLVFRKILRTYQLNVPEAFKKLLKLMNTFVQDCGPDNDNRYFQTQPAFTCSKSIIETPEQSVKIAQT